MIVVKPEPDIELSPPSPPAVTEPPERPVPPPPTVIVYVVPVVAVNVLSLDEPPPVFSEA